MAKKKKAKPELKPAKPAPLDICACPSGSRVQTIEGRSVCLTAKKEPREPVCTRKSPEYAVGEPSVGATAVPAAFTYNSPSTVQEIGQKARRERGCLVERVKVIVKKDTKQYKAGTVIEREVKLPFACPPGSSPTGKDCMTAAGERIAPVPAELCGKTAKPCSSSRKTCPVQLVYRQGRPHLRFCLKAGNNKPGWLVPVQSPSAAMELAKEACEQWAANKRRFTEKNAAAIKAKAARAGYAGPDNALGRLFRQTSARY